jgi:integral membrane sensor domain MASE1
MVRIWARFTCSWRWPSFVLGLGLAVVVVLGFLDQVPGNQQLDIDPPWGSNLALLAIGLLVLGLIGFVQSESRKKFAGDDARRSLGQLSKLLDSASAAIQALRREILDQEDRLEALRREVSENQTLAAMSPEQIEHVLSAHQRTVPHKREWVVALVSALVGAIVGWALVAVFGG